MMVDGVPLPLALEDAVPVALSTAGLLVLAAAVRRRAGRPLGAVATTSAVLIGAGGTAKVAWKLVAAVGGTDTWIDGLLFPLLAIGFIGMALTLRAVRKSGPTPRMRGIATNDGESTDLRRGESTDPRRVVAAMAAVAVGLLAVLALQWTEQSINTLSQALFLWAVVRLASELAASPTARGEASVPVGANTL